MKMKEFGPPSGGGRPLAPPSIHQCVDPTLVDLGGTRVSNSFIFLAVFWQKHSQSNRLAHPCGESKGGAPYGPKISQFHAGFFGKMLAKIVGWRLLLEG